MIDEIKDSQASEFRCAIVSVVGRPNVGKSTLVNALINRDLSITSVHPHTTRRQIRAIDNGVDYQIIYVDTPGIHKPRGPMSERMNESAYDAAVGVDLIVAVFDGSADIGKGDAFVAGHLKDSNNVIVVLNKCDSEKSMEKIADRAKKISELLPNAQAIFLSSAFTKKNVNLIKKAIKEKLVPGPALFDRESQHDLTDNELVAELVRESLIRMLRDELPSGILVVAKESDESKKDQRRFDVKIVVLRDSHKGIVIGKGGSMLESAGTKARAKAESLLGSLIVLKTRVVVDENWQSKSENPDSYFL